MMFSLPWSWRRNQDPSRPRGQRPQLERLEDRLQPSIVAVSGTDQKINVSAPLNQTLPSVAMDANGDFVVAWSDQTHLGPMYEYNVDARVYNRAGQAQTGEIVVAQTTGGTRPSVAMDANGDFVVSWEVLNTSSYHYGVSAQRYNLAGTAQGGNIVITSGSSVATDGESPKVAMDSTGDFVIAYQGYDANSHGIFAQRFNAAGVSQGTGIFPVNTVTTGNQGAPTIAMDSAGDFAIAWQDGGQAQAAGIYAQRYNSSAVAQGGNTAISTVVSTAPGNPSVAMEPTGQYAIAWQFTQTAPGTGNGTQGIETQRYSATGAALTGVVQLNTPENYNQGNPAVAIDSEGDFVVAWNSYGQGGTASSLATIIAQRVNSGGTLIGPTQFTPSTQSGDNQRFPSVANDPNGDTMIVWESKPSTSSPNQDVYGRLYNHVNDAPTINTPSNVSINENAGQQTVNLTGIAAGGGETQTLAVSASSNNSALVNPSPTYTSPNSTGTLTFTPAANSFGTATITVTVMDNGGTQNGGVDTTQVQFTVTVHQVSATVSAISANWGANGTAALTTAADGPRLLPTGRTTSLPWLNINKLSVTLSSAATLSPGDVSVTGSTVANYGPVTISGSGTSYTITFAQPISAVDRVTVTIGNAIITTYTRRLDVLPGDTNDDGVVNTTDMVLIRSQFGATTATNLASDINGSGTVDVTDFNAGRALIGTALPGPLFAAPGGVAAASELPLPTFLTQAELAPILSASIQRWEASGLTAAQDMQLHGVTAQIVNIKGGYLGQTLLGSSTIMVDDDGAGFGWYIDPTPMSDSEFPIMASSTRSYATPTSPAAGRMDLLTVVMHELGHVLGKDSLFGSSDQNNLMYAYLTTGERRLPPIRVAAVGLPVGILGLVPAQPAGLIVTSPAIAQVSMASFPAPVAPAQTNATDLPIWLMAAARRQQQPLIDLALEPTSED
jgi:Bacterial Ig domain/Dockerin type I domain